MQVIILTDYMTVNDYKLDFSVHYSPFPLLPHFLSPVAHEDEYGKEGRPSEARNDEDDNAH